MLCKLTQENTYIQSASKHTIDSIINSLYKLLSEDYCTVVINYTEKTVNIQRKQRLIKQLLALKHFLRRKYAFNYIYKYKYIPS